MRRMHIIFLSRKYSLISREQYDRCGHLLTVATVYCTGVGIYKRKQESKKGNETSLWPRNRPRKKTSVFSFFFLTVLFSFIYSSVYLWYTDTFWWILTFESGRERDAKKNIARKKLDYFPPGEKCLKLTDLRVRYHSKISQPPNWQQGNLT